MSTDSTSPNTSQPSKPPAKTAAQRQAAMRARKKAAGLIHLFVQLKPAVHRRLTKLAAKSGTTLAETIERLVSPPK